MVQIATSRDVGFVNTRSGRIAPSAPVGQVADALAEAGQNIQQAAYNLNDLRASESRDVQAKTGYDLETKLTQFRAQEEEIFNKAQAESSESGIGFTRQHIEAYQKRADDFIKSNFGGVSEAQNASARQSLLGLGNSIYTKAYDYEQKAKTNFYDRTTNQGLDTVRTQIRNNAAPYEELKRQGLAAIDKADMPEPWKAERRALWDADALESKWQWKFEQDPKTAIAEMKGTGGSFIDKVIGVESGGNATAKNPNSSATGLGQFISSTWMNMVKQYRPDLMEGRSADEVLALRNDPGISREMTQRYADENASFLQNQGVQTTDGNLYLAHFLGPRGAAQVLKADPSASVESVVGSGVVNANPFLKGMSAADIKAWSDKKMGGTGSSEYEAIPYERRQALASEAETAYSQQINKERSAAKERYSLLIATTPQAVTQQMIVNDPRIDDGDKATLINSLTTANKERGATDALISAMTQGKVSVNPFDGEQTKAADGAYDKMLGAAASPQEQSAVTADFVDRTGYVPKKVQAELRHGAASSDPATMAQSMEAAMTLSSMVPGGFNFDGSAGLTKKMDVYRAFTRDMGYSPEEAARRLVDANDPEKAAQRSALVKSEPVKKFMKDVDEGTVAGIFDQGWFSPAPALGANPGAGAAMVADYKALLEESIVDAGGDLDAAKKAANTRFARVYGTSEFSTLRNTVIRNPVERAYPAGADGTHEWVRSQAIEALQGEGIATDEIFLMPMPDGGTAKDIETGRPPRYQILYTDKERGTIEALNVPFFADAQIEKERAKASLDTKVSTSEQRMVEGRGGAVMEQAGADAVRAARDAAAKQYEGYAEPFRDQKVREAERNAMEQNTAQEPTNQPAPAPRERTGGLKVGGYNLGGGGW